MKKIIVTGAVAAIAAVSFAGTASAAPDASKPQCFGQVHKEINTNGLLNDFKISNVGQLVQSPILADLELGKTGQGKNTAAKVLFCTPAS